MQQLCPQWEIISLLNSQAALPSVQLWFWRQLSPQNQHRQTSCWLWKLEGQGFWCQEGKSHLELLFLGWSVQIWQVSMISRNLVLCFSLLPSWAHPMQPVYKTNSIIINQPVIFNAHICSPISRIQDLLSACPASPVSKAASGLLPGGKLIQTFYSQESSSICSFLTVVTSVFLHPVNRSVQVEMLRKIWIAKSNVVPPWKPMTLLCNPFPEGAACLSILELTGTLTQVRRFSLQ